jgi:hypothetical protein
MIDRLIENATALDRLIRFISRQQYPFRVTITDGRPRSYDQNRLFHQWVKDAADQRPGMTTLDIQCEWKLLHAVPILVAENVAFSDMWSDIAEGLNYSQQLKLVAFIPATSLMTVDQFKRCLDAIEQYNIENGIELTDTEERRYGPKIGSRVDRGDAGSGDPFDRAEADRQASGRKVR